MIQVSGIVGVNIDHINDIAEPDIVFYMYELFEVAGVTWDFVSQNIGEISPGDSENYLFKDAIGFWYKMWDYEWQRYRLVNETW